MKLPFLSVISSELLFVSWEESFYLFDEFSFSCSDISRTETWVSFLGERFGGELLIESPEVS